MSKIFIIMGKSATGKDTVFKRLLEDKQLQLKSVVGYTTRPIRSAEMDGMEYFFVDDDTLQEFIKENKVIEHRAYPTVHGTWNYFTVNDGQIDLTKSDYLFIGTLESYIQIRNYYGEKSVIPIYLEVEDGLRLKRALHRERKQEEPRYKELCRRYLADEEDFSEEKLKEAGIGKRYQNVDINICLFEITQDIKNELQNK